LGAARQMENRAPEFAPVEDNDGENGSELDDNLEDLSQGLGKIDEIAGEYEMPGRRDRQEFGYTLDDAEANGLRPNMEVGQLRVLRWKTGSDPLATFHANVQSAAGGVGVSLKELLAWMRPSPRFAPTLFETPNDPTRTNARSSDTDIGRCTG